MRRSVDEAFQKYGDRVFSAAFSICRSREDADDVVQDTFLKYHLRDQDYIDDAHLKAWLLRVAINRAKDISRAFWRRNRVSWEEYMDELEFVQPEDRTLFQAVMALPERYRTVIHLFYYEEYSIPEIASVLGRSHLNAPEVSYREDGTVWVYWKAQAMEITDKFNDDGICFLQLKDGEETKFLTIKYQNGYSMSSQAFIQPEEFN